MMWIDDEHIKTMKEVNLNTYQVCLNSSCLDSDVETGAAISITKLPEVLVTRLSAE